MVVLHGQTLLDRGIIAISLDKFCGYWSIHKNHSLRMIYSLGAKTYKNLTFVNINMLAVHTSVTVTLVKHVWIYN